MGKGTVRLPGVAGSGGMEGAEAFGKLAGGFNFWWVRVSTTSFRMVRTSQILDPWPLVIERLNIFWSTFLSIPSNL